MPTSSTRRNGASKAPRLGLAVQYAVKPSGVPTPAQFRRWARAALERDARITVRIVGDNEGRALNSRFRGRRRATNVLSFTLSRAPRLEGDIALCAPVIAREARTQGKDRTAHYAHLVVHGVLHLQGYDHATRRQALRMERRETRIVTGLGYPDPYGAT